MMPNYTDFFLPSQKLKNLTLLSEMFSDYIELMVVLLAEKLEILSCKNFERIENWFLGETCFLKSLSFTMGLICKRNIVKYFNEDLNYKNLYFIDTNNILSVKIRTDLF